MSNNGKGLSALYARDTRDVDEEPASSRKRSRFDEVGELGRDSRETSDSRVRDTRDSRDSRERESRDCDRYRDDRDGRSRDYERHREPREDRHESRDDSRNDERSKRHRDDREHEKDREYDRYRRERSDKYRENNERNDRGYDRGNNSRVRYDRRHEGRVGGGGHGAIEIPFDRFLRLSPWRGPVTPLEERPRHLKNWDVAPAGFERISADKAKLTGLFPPPGNIAKTGNYVPPTLDPARAAMFQLLNRDTAGTSVNGNNNNSNVSNPSAELSGNLLKQAKRFYVGNLPFNFNETILVEFLETNLRGLSGGNGNGSNKNYDENRIILTINVSTDRSYAFVECRTAEDASLAMNLDGVVFEGTQLKVRRPKEYHVALTTGLLSSTSTAAGANSTAMAATSTSPQLDNSIVNRRQLIISGIPDILTGDHVKSLLLLIADLRTFILLKDRESDESLGVAMFEFVEDFEGEEWSGPFLKHSKGSLFMGPFEMKIQRVCDLMESDENQSLRDLLSIYNLQPGFSTAPSSTPILQLLNIVTKEGLLLDYDSIYQDLNQELTKYSNSAIDLVIPKPADKTLIPGVGKVFVKFGTVEEAARAASELAGRIFDGHTCIVSFYPPEKFDKKLY